MDSLPPTIQRLLQTSPVKKFARNKIIHYIDEPASTVFVLKRGAVKIYDIDDQGNEKVLHIIQPYTIFPFAFHSGKQARAHWFWGALTDCEAYVLDAVKLRRALYSNGALAMDVLLDFSQDVHELLTRLCSLGKTNASDKVVAALRFLAVRHSRPLPDGWLRVTFPVSHQLVADLVGITRESVAVVMKSLQTKEIIRNPRNTLLEINTQQLFST